MDKSSLIRNYSVKAFRHSSALPTNTIYFSVRLLLFLFQQKREQNLRLCRKVFLATNLQSLPYLLLTKVNSKLSLKGRIMKLYFWKESMSSNQAKNNLPRIY